MDARVDLVAQGERIRDLRNQLGLSQTALAAKAQISPSFLSLIETGRRGAKSKILDALAERLGTTTGFLELGTRADLDAQVRLAVDFAFLELRDGNVSAARRRLETLDLEAVSGEAKARVLTALALAHELSGELEEAVDILESVLEDARAREHLIDAAAAALALIGCLISAGDLLRATEVGEQELTQFERAGLAGTDEHLRLGATLLWANIERGDLTTATRRAARLISQGEEHGTPRGRGSVYWNAALLAEERRNFVLAKRYTERAIALLGEYDSGRDLHRLRLHYAHLLTVSAPPAPLEALGQLEHAESAIRLVGSPVDVGTLEIERARALLLLGDFSAAEQNALAALDSLGPDPRLEAAEAQVVLGDVRQALGHLDQALAAYQWAAERLSLMSAHRRSARAWRKLGDRYRALGLFERSTDAYSRGMSEAGFLPSPVHEYTF